MALTAFVGYEWLQTVLKADATLQATFGNPARVYQRDAPEGIPTYPLLLIRFVSGIPLMVLGAQDVYTNALYDVIAVTKDNSTSSIKAGINRVDTVLNRARGSTADGTVWFCSKSPDHTEIATTDPPVSGGGARVQNLGRTWRLIVQGA